MTAEDAPIAPVEEELKIDEIKLEEEKELICGFNLNLLQVKISFWHSQIHYLITPNLCSGTLLLI